MAEPHNQRPSQWPRLFTIACELIDQVAERTGGYDFQWSFGGGAAMMIQIEHRESHDIDIFFDDPQLLGFLDPAKSVLRFSVQPNDYVGDGARFQKFAFADIGEIDFIAAGGGLYSSRRSPKLSPRRSITGAVRPNPGTSSISPLRRATTGRRWSKSCRTTLTKSSRRKRGLKS